MTTDTAASVFLILQNPDVPLLLLCACGGPALVGEYLVAEVLDDGGRLGLCDTCARQAAPEAAACTEALNILATAASGLSREHAARVLCALVEQVARLAGPTVAFLNVNPTLIERINRDHA